MNFLNKLTSVLSNRLLADSGLSFFILIFAITCSLLISNGRYILNPDGILEINTAMNFANGNGFYVSKATENGINKHFDITKPPLYQFFIACLITLGVSGKWASWIISQGSFVLSAVALYNLARICMPKVPSLLIGCLFCVLISNQKWGITAKEDTLYMAFTFLSLFLFSKLRLSKQTNYFFWILLGVLAAGSILTRYLGITLIASIFIILAYESIMKKSSLKHLWLFSIGIVLTGLLPFINFVSAWLNGVRPGFFEAQDTTWYLTIAGIAHSFQLDFLGAIIVWLVDQSISDQIIVYTFLCILIGIIFWFIRFNTNLSVVGLYVIIYLVILTIQLASKGFYPYENRFSFPIEGLLILIISYFIWVIYKRNAVLFPKMIFGVFATFLVCIYLNGQWLYYKKFDSFLSDPGVPKEFCPSPKAIAWIQSNVPSGEIIFGNQCSYQLLAETNDYFWLTIPPTDTYASSERYNVKWKEEDFINIRKKTGARWIVLLTGQTGDPFKERPGYGEFVNKLYDGKETSNIKLQVAFSDGMVFKIK